MGSYPGLFRWSPYNHKSHERGSRRASVRVIRVRKTRPAIRGFEDGRGLGAKERRQLLEAGKGKKTDSPLEPLEGTQSCQQMILAQ